MSFVQQKRYILQQFYPFDFSAEQTVTHFKFAIPQNHLTLHLMVTI
jgi:hypothetical protein